jgi:hypothetical protein
MRARKLYLLPLVVHAITPFVLPAYAEKLTVPADSSLSSAEYVDLGVPDPRDTWTGNEYEQALRVLSGIPRPQLPRVGSKRSQLVFERLLMTYAREFDLDFDEEHEHVADHTSPPPSLPELYSTTHEDYLLFDKELVAIRCEALARSLNNLPTRAHLSALVNRFAERLETATSEAVRTQMTESARQSEETAEAIADLVKRQTSELLAIAAIPEITDPARQQMLQKAETLLPQLPKHLPANDVRWIANLLRGAASAERNASIRPGLLKLANELDAVD